MRKKVTYVSFDGKEFDTEMECHEYEENHRDFLKVRGAIDTLKKYCSCLLYTSPSPRD